MEGTAAARTKSALQAHASYRTVAVDHAETEPARRRQALPDQLSREDITFDVDDLLSLAERSRRPGRVGAAPPIVSARATSASVFPPSALPARADRRRQLAIDNCVPTGVQTACANNPGLAISLAIGRSGAAG